MMISHSYVSLPEAIFNDSENLQNSHGIPSSTEPPITGHQLPLLLPRKMHPVGSAGHNARADRVQWDGAVQRVEPGLSKLRKSAKFEIFHNSYNVRPPLDS